MTKYKNIPTNIISGFLGAGKTTAIQYLLEQKPESERWAVIVNEFGQIGIDGALLQNDSVAIKEIPGGCLCCVGSQSLSVGLNQVIRQIKPQRILIEPTGLGHPKNLIESLSGEYYKDVLDLRAVVNLLDARQLNDKRYMNHETFLAQLQLADVLVANKLDSYTEEDKQRFYDYALLCKPAKLKVAMVEQGKLLPDWLDLQHVFDRQALSSAAHEHQHQHRHHEHLLDTECEIQSSDWLMVEGSANDYMSIGWQVNPLYQFREDALHDWINRVFENTAVERIKAVMHTDNGWLSINHTRSEQKTGKREAHSFSIFEIIASQQLQSSKLDVQLKSLTIK